MALAALNPPSPHPMQLNGEHLLLAGDVYVPITELGRGKSAVSYLYQQAEGHSAQGLPLQLVLKRYCSTPIRPSPSPRRWSLNCAAICDCSRRT